MNSNSTGSEIVPYVPKVEPPLDEIEIEDRYTRSNKDERKPHLVISLECLDMILARENSIIAREAVPRLIAGLCGYAARADISDVGLVAFLKDYYERLVDDQKDRRI